MPTVVIHHGIAENIVSPQMSLCSYTSPHDPSEKKSTEYDNDENESENNNEKMANLNFSSVLNNLIPDNDTIKLSNLSEERKFSTKTCLMYYLSNNNYDVWLLEARGTSPVTTRHVNESISKEDYWNFNLEDQALRDVPAQIAKVKEISGKEKVAYIGYSISTSYLFILLSERPEFAHNFTTAIAVAPVAFCSHIRGLARPASQFAALLGKSVNLVNIPLFGTNRLLGAVNGLINVLCESRLVATTLCRAVINTIAGPDKFENILVSNCGCKSANNQFNH